MDGILLSLVVYSRQRFLSNEVRLYQEFTQLNDIGKLWSKLMKRNGVRGLSNELVSVKALSSFYIILIYVR
jgi:hypothetical protein